MAKGGLIIDLIGKGPGDEEEDDLPSDDEDEDPEDRAKPNPDALISSIQAQLDELRRAY